MAFLLVALWVLGLGLGLDLGLAAVLAHCTAGYTAHEFRYTPTNKHWFLAHNTP
jgi:hypothetical protein